MENLRRDARMRVDTDSEMSVGWIIVPILPYVLSGIYYAVILLAALSFSPSSFNSTSTGPNPAAASAVIALIGVFLLIAVLGLVIGILNAIMVYKLVKRRNTHFARQLLLYEDLYNMGREVAGRKGVDAAIPLNNLDRNVREARFEETPKSAALWAILGFFPVIGTITNWYVNYFLMKDFYKHERREDAYFMDVTSLLSASGVPVNLPRRVLPTPDRSFVLYLILTIVTAGLFGIYWVYVLVTDPNNHFRQQWMIEDTLIAQASPILGGPTMPPPSTPPPPSYPPSASPPPSPP